MGRWLFADFHVFQVIGGDVADDDDDAGFVFFGCEENKLTEVLTHFFLVDVHHLIAFLLLHELFILMGLHVGFSHFLDFLSQTFIIGIEDVDALELVHVAFGEGHLASHLTCHGEHGLGDIHGLNSFYLAQGIG